MNTQANTGLGITAPVVRPSPAIQSYFYPCKVFSIISNIQNNRRKMKIGDRMMSDAKFGKLT